MSIALMTEVWKMQMAMSDKIVLLALADAANDDGVTWMAVKTRSDKLDMLTKCSMSERAIQGAIKRLCADGHLSRQERPGKGVIYTVTPNPDACRLPADPRTSCGPTPAADAPPQEMRPAANDTDPRSSCGETVSNRQSISEAKASSISRAENDNALSEEASPSRELALIGQAGAGKPKRVFAKPQKFVPEAWVPNPAHVAKAETLGVDLAKQVELFRNYEYAKPKTDFDRAFHTWLQNAGGRFAERPNSQRGAAGGWDPMQQAIEGIDFSKDFAA